MQMEEKQIESIVKYQGKILDLTVDTVLLPDGNQAKREVVHHRGGVAIVAVDGNQQVTLVTQYRYAYGEPVLEIVAGKKEIGEQPLYTAERELAEEAGLGAKQWKHLTSLYPTPGYTDEVIEIFLATDLYENQEKPDDDEFLEVQTMPLARAAEMVLEGKIKDAKTQVGLLLAANTLGLFGKYS